MGSQVITKALWVGNGMVTDFERPVSPDCGEQLSQGGMRRGFQALHRPWRRVKRVAEGVATRDDKCAGTCRF